MVAALVVLVVLGTMYNWARSIWFAKNRGHYPNELPHRAPVTRHRDGGAA